MFEGYNGRTYSLSKAANSAYLENNGPITMGTYGTGCSYLHKKEDNTNMSLCVAVVSRDETILIVDSRSISAVTGDVLSDEYVKLTKINAKGIPIFAISAGINDFGGKTFQEIVESVDFSDIFAETPSDFMEVSLRLQNEFSRQTSDSHCLFIGNSCFNLALASYIDTNESGQRCLLIGFFDVIDGKSIAHYTSYFKAEEKDYFELYFMGTKEAREKFNKDFKKADGSLIDKAKAAMKSAIDDSSLPSVGGNACIARITSDGKYEWLQNKPE